VLTSEQNEWIEKLRDHAVEMSIGDQLNLMTLRPDDVINLCNAALSHLEAAPSWEGEPELVELEACLRSMAETFKRIEWAKGEIEEESADNLVRYGADHITALQGLIRRVIRAWDEVPSLRVLKMKSNSKPKEAK
jgi:hypothetical protein